MKSLLYDRSWANAPVNAGPYRSWLTDRGSLTHRIADRCERFRIEVVFQGLRKPTRDEGFLFADRGRARVLVREVYLCCGKTPVVFAHSVTRPRDVRGPWRSLIGLGSRSLGSELFTDPRVRRCPLRQKKIGAGHELYTRALQRAPHAAQSLWARRSLFVLHKSPILVTEVFLPGILDL
ncbi:MAG: chorismate--pyruvate lyase family protein [Rhodospirillaceae bacterium]